MYDPEFLCLLYSRVHNNPAWLSQIADALNFDEHDFHFLETLDENHREVLRGMEEQWRHVRRANGNNENIREDVKREDPVFQSDCRRRYLEERIEAYRKDIAEIRNEDKEMSDRGSPYADRRLMRDLRGLETLERNLDRHTRELSGILKNRERNKLDEHIIDRARAADITKVIDADRSGYAKCLNPEHADSKPSMLVRGTFAYCFACGFSIDAIGYLMKHRGMKFPEAVEALQ